MSQRMSDVYLFYGVHYSNNYLYKNILEGFQSQSGLNCFIAASRDGSKMHVQDKLIENGQQVVKLLEKDAAVVVCGSKKFVASIEDCFIKILQPTNADPKKLLQDLKQKKTFLWESWGE